MTCKFINLRLMRNKFIVWTFQYFGSGKYQFFYILRQNRNSMKCTNNFSVLTKSLFLFVSCEFSESSVFHTSVIQVIAIFGVINVSEAGARDFHSHLVLVHFRFSPCANNIFLSLVKNWHSLISVVQVHVIVEMALGSPGDREWGFFILGQIKYPRGWGSAMGDPRKFPSIE